MGHSASSSSAWLLGPAAALACCVTLSGEPVVVKHVEGSAHGFLVLRTLGGTAIADGDMIQFAVGNRVTNRLVFHFKDGSLHDETTVFSQGREFRLLSDHLVQKGPAFPQPLDLTIDRGGDVTVRSSAEGGPPEVETEHFDLPLDVSNGLIPTLLKNVRPDASPKTLSYLAFTPKPRLVKLAVTTAGEEHFSIGGSGRTATHFVLKVEIGGFSGLVAPLIGKQPPDLHVWILGGEVPAFVKAELSLYFGGPVWRIELASPSWQRNTTATK
jgi:hypothetical protein